MLLAGPCSCCSRSSPTGSHIGLAPWLLIEAFRHRWRLGPGARQRWLRGCSDGASVLFALFLALHEDFALVLT